MTEQKVANPRKADLVRLRGDLAREVERLRTALRRPTQDLGGDKVWVGRNARSWHTGLVGRDRKLGIEVDKLLPLLDAAIRTEPDRISPADARAYRQDT
ncbi:hypothetical protein [Streptomyces sp. NPDC002265]|uniref:hypothetical protein n=1 Tax=Streptomyces sp. NPDC002265 TaxID=3154415 RepID=UPI00333357B9